MKTVERRYILVGIRMDSHSRQLLNWTLVKVAEPGDCVIALHVVTSPDFVSKSKPLLDSYFEVYQGLCDMKKVGLSGQILTGTSIRNILVREAKNRAALALVLGGRASTSTAKYCAKQLPPTTNVVAIQGSRIVFRRCTNKQLPANLIGKGGSNHVYKGILPDGKPIAVKVLQSSKEEALKDFALEVEILSSLKHKSITPLLGICIEDSALISVYDYFPKGGLEENLHGKNKDGSFLSWEVRFNVAVRVAEALNYLHNETEKPVIHRDVKSSNILLSQSHGFEPQLSDFGLAIRGPTTSSFLTQDDLVGTFGYLAPEYFMYGKVSDKIDVYAFGVVLLELISGRQPISSETCKGHESLVMWAKPILDSGDVKGLLDPNLQGKFDAVQMQKMVLAASLCITRAARLRPTLNQILKILKGDEKIENFLNSHENDHVHVHDHSENQENIDDEVYPNSSAELHLSLALLDVDNDTTSYGSTEHSNSEHLKEQWSRSSSFN